LLFIENAPGNSSQQLVFCHYLQRSNVSIAFATAFLYPLFPSILYLLIGAIPVVELTQDTFYFYCFEILSVGVRCAVVSYLLRYSLKMPVDKFDWINYFGTMVIGLLLNAYPGTHNTSNGLFLLYAVIGMLAYYRNIETRES
jgi:hypothetical protein